MKAFFDSLRDSFGPLKQNQVTGIELLLQATDKLSIRHRAYILATAWHETGPASSNLHMTPRREIWGPTAAQTRYEGRADLGNTQAGDGKRFLGRGFVQITGRANYHKASNLVGKDLVNNPDLALDPEIAARIIVHGMTVGWFTGKKMADYDSYVNMRRVVNGTDKAELIASYAEDFEKALKALPASPVAPVEPAPAPIPPPAPETPPAATPEAPETPAQSLAKWVMAAVGMALAALMGWMMKG
jgi:hypothetical protein